MSDLADERAVAEAKVTAARQRVNETVSTLQHRLQPRRLIGEVKGEITTAGTSAAKAGVASVRRNPGAVVSAAVLLALLAARRPIGRLFRRSERATRPSRKS